MQPLRLSYQQTISVLISYSRNAADVHDWSLDSPIRRNVAHFGGDEPSPLCWNDDALEIISFDRWS